MFNAMNALSSSESLLTLPLWENMVLVYAISLSMVLHFALLYIPFLQGLFAIVPLNWNEWQAVILISLPVMYTLSPQPHYFITKLLIVCGCPVSSMKSSSSSRGRSISRRRMIRR